MSSLKDKWIVITRPKHQAEALRLKLEAEGANIILFPLLEIKLPDNITLAKQQLAQIEDYDLAIFTSANAVDYSLRLLDKAKLQNKLQSTLKTLKVAAIGKKTAKLLEEKYAIKVDYFPSRGFNSEALLMMPEIKAYREDKNILILRGQDGREFLKEGLEAQGADVKYIDVYKRFFPQENLNVLKQQFNKNQLDIILITSGTSLMNLFKFSADNKWLENSSLLIGSNRIKTQLINCYKFHGNVLSASDPSDETLYRELLKWGQG